MERLDTLEETVRGIQGLSVEDVRRELMAELVSVRTQIGNITASVPAGAQTREGRSLYNSKEFIPDKLGSGYKDQWRSWAYKARDWLSQYDPKLPEKLMAVESKDAELTPEYIAAQEISEAAELEIRRFSSTPAGR